jgi:hypothetical protein
MKQRTILLHFSKFGASTSNASNQVILNDSKLGETCGEQGISQRRLVSRACRGKSSFFDDGRDGTATAAAVGRRWRARRRAL